MSRKELLAAAAFVLVNVLVPAFAVELYPFSRAPMFEDAPRRYCDFIVYGPDGQALPAADFGLQRNYHANPPDAGYGYRPPPTINEMDAVPDTQQVAAWVRQHLEAFPRPEYVEVVQQVVGPVDGDRVGVVESRRTRVTNPSYRGSP
jgi:hypothetical protein